MSLITEPLICNPTDDEVKEHTVLVEEIDETIITICIEMVSANYQNQTISLDVGPSFTVEKVKQMINSQWAISVQDQNIIFNCKVLQNDKTLQHYNIIHRSVLKMDPLAEVLLQNNLYNKLYAILTNNNVDLGTLQNDLKQSEIDEFCSALDFSLLQKVKFRNLMRIITPKSKVNIKHDNEVTIILVGDERAGKTSLINRYVDDRFDIYVKSTIGTAPKCHYETFSNDTVTKITIWDTAGQERFHSLCKSYYRKADVILLCYDVNDDKKFNNFYKWKGEIEEYCVDDVVVIFVSCKGDLLKNNLDEGKEIMNQDNWEAFTTVYCQCSAKTGDNVRNVFRTGAELKLLKSQNKNSGNKNGTEEKNIDIEKNADEPPKQERSCCVVL